MRPDQIQLEVVTPERAVLAEEVDAVVLPGTNGELGVLPGHVPLLTRLDIGEMVVHSSGEQRRFFIVRGFAEILGDQVRVLAQECEGVEEIDVEKARAELEEAEQEVQKLEERRDEDEEDMLERYRDSLRKNRQRLMMSGEMDE
ncbi:MAG: F0F1 ATP synthase subunit epsilon [Bradymonadaceae bacterium]